MSTVLPIEPDSRYRTSTATAGQTAFTVPFPFQDNGDLVVTKTPAATGVSATLEEGADYTLSGAGSPSGGTVTLTAAAAAGDRIEIVGQAILSRLGSIVSAGRYASALTDSELDRNRIIQQEQARDIGRAFKAPLGAPGGTIEVGPAGSTLVFDAAGNLRSGQYAVSDTSAATGITLVYDASTSAADPGDGKFRINDETHSTATALYIDNVEALAGANIASLLDSWGASTSAVKGELKIAKASDPRVFRIYSIIDPVVDSSGFRTISILHLSSSGELSDGDECVLMFLGTGDKASLSDRPIVILCSGQSNAVRFLDYSWAPPGNLRIWNWDGNVDDDGDTGTAFGGAPANKISIANAMGAMEAWANPGSTVYVINISIGGLPLSQWLTGASSPDMYQAIKQNVEAALTAIGADHVDVLQWWQGEANIGSPSGYVTDFATLMARFRAEDWFPLQTPVILHGISSLAGSSYANFNRALTASAAFDPTYLRYVHTAALPVDYWDPSGSVPYIHANADGAYAAGVMAWQSWRSGAGDPSLRGIVIDPATGNILIGASGIPGSEVLNIRRDQSSSAIVQVDNEQANSAATADFRAKTDAGTFTMRAYPTQFVPYARLEWTGSGFMQFVLPAGVNNQFEWLLGSATAMRLNASGNLAVGTGTPDRRLHSEVDDASNTGITYAERLTHTTSGTPGNGIGVGMEFEVETSASNNEIGATIEAVVTDATATSEDFDLVVKLMAAGAAAAERLRLKSTGELILKPPSSAAALGTNGQVTIELTNNTTLTFKARGSDGTTRSGTITLA